MGPIRMRSLFGASGKKQLALLGITVGLAMAGCSREKPPQDITEYRILMFRYLAIQKASTERVLALKGLGPEKSLEGLLKSDEIKLKEIDRLRSDLYMRNDFEGENEIGTLFIELIHFESSNLRHTITILTRDDEPRVRNKLLRDANTAREHTYDLILPRLYKLLEIEDKSTRIQEQVSSPVRGQSQRLAL